LPEKTVEDVEEEGALHEVSVFTRVKANVGHALGPEALHALLDLHRDVPDSLVIGYSRRTLRDLQIQLDPVLAERIAESRARHEPEKVPILRCDSNCPFHAFSVQAVRTHCQGNT
jgi:hypothetical protein